MQVGDLVISKVNGDIGLIVGTKLWRWQNPSPGLGTRSKPVTTMIVMSNSSIQEWLLQNIAVIKNEMKISPSVLAYK